jgi:hydrogenase maturation protein HypF
VPCGFRTEGIFAAGAELVNSFAIGRDSQAFLSPYIGDLKNLETFQFYREMFRRYSRMFRFSPGVVVHDLHPDYLSTRFAKELAESRSGITIFPVQHHHAHLASVMAENRMIGEVIGFSFDGLGLGSDGTLWGAEAMTGSYASCVRKLHFEPVPLPGGDRANEEPWRMAVSYLHTFFGDEFRDWKLPLREAIPEKKLDGVLELLTRRVNSPPISSAGRLFDAMASLLGITHFNRYTAEAPMKLEAVADPGERGEYPVDIRTDVVSFRPMFEQAVREVLSGLPASTLSARFHNTLVRTVLEMAVRIREETALQQVVLAGGTFQNRILSEGIESGLESLGFQVFRASRVPVNDQGIALGQLAIAAAIRDS